MAEDGIAEPEIIDRLQDMADKHMAAKALRFGPETMRMAEKSLLLQVLDQQWKEHLLQPISCVRGLACAPMPRKTRSNEYKKEAFHMFESMLIRMRQTVTMALAHVELRSPEADQEAGAEPDPASQPADTPAQPAAMPAGKVPRNAPAPVVQAKNTSIVMACLH